MTGALVIRKPAIAVGEEFSANAVAMIGSIFASICLISLIHGLMLRSYKPLAEEAVVVAQAKNAIVYKIQDDLTERGLADEAVKLDKYLS